MFNQFQFHQHKAKTMNDIVIIDNLNPIEVFTGDGIDPVLESIANEARSFVPDMSTEQGRKDIASIAYKVSRSKTTLDTMGKELTADWKKRAKLVDGSRKKIREFLDGLRDEVRQPLTEWENKEKQRLADLEILVANITISGQMAVDDWEALTIPELNIIRDMTDQIEISEEVWQEFELNAMRAKKQALINIDHALSLRNAKEKELIEAKEKLQREKAEREQEIADKAAEQARIKAEKEAEDNRKAAEQEKIDRIAEVEAEKQEAIDKAKQAEDDRIKSEQAAEKARIEAQEKAERDRIAATEKAEREKQEAIDAERKKSEALEQAVVAAKEKERKAAEKKAANKAHQRKINRDALASFVENGIPEAEAEIIISLIINSHIKNITINY